MLPSVVTVIIIVLVIAGIVLVAVFLRRRSKTRKIKIEQMNAVQMSKVQAKAEDLEKIFIPEDELVADSTDGVSFDNPNYTNMPQ